MTKLSRKSLDPQKFGHYVNNLWSAFTLAATKDDIRLLFKDLFTHTEYKMFAKRLEIAKMLLDKESYESIQDELSVTAQTISKINNILAEKGEGLRKAVRNLERLEIRRSQQEQEYRQNLSNPFRKASKRRTVLGAVMKVGLAKLDKKISKHLKDRSAKKELIV